MKSKLPDSAFDRNSTPTSIREGAHIHRCLRKLFSKLPKPNRILELFGGLGDMTKLVQEFYPSVPIQSWDIDSRCVLVLSKIPGVQAKCGNSLVLARAEAEDGVILDHNSFTLKTARTILSVVMKRLLKVSPLWVCINDCAVSKLHLNYRRYGCKDRYIQSYIDAYDEMYKDLGYRVVAYSGHARATQIALGRIL